MERRNGSSEAVFFLVGLSQDPIIQLLLFVSFLVMYIATVSGNFILITVCVYEPLLHTPMYFFLVNLSVVDICYSTAIVPNTLVQLIAKRRMSFSACAAQIYSFVLLASTESLLLAVMAYDRFVAISFALRYNIIMSKSLCIKMATCCWVSGTLMAALDTIFPLQLPFCGHNVIDHFFCEPNTRLKMACADSFIAEMVLFSVAIFVLLMPILIILVSYIRIGITILGIRTTQGRYKAFSTCTSHLTVVTLAIGTAIFTYMKPVSKSSENHDKMFAVFHTVIPPILNPMIYSLKNKDVQMALMKVIQRNRFH